MSTRRSSTRVTPARSAPAAAAAAAPKAKAGAKRKHKAEHTGEDDDADEENEAPPAKKAAAAAAGKKKGAASSSSSGGAAFDGLVFCVSGAFSLSQGAMKSLLESQGGRVVSTVNKQCTHVVADAIGSGKSEKAVEQGLPVVTEAWVNESVAAGKPSTDKKLFLSGGGNGAAEGGNDEGDDKAEASGGKKDTAVSSSSTSGSSDAPSLYYAYYQNYEENGDEPFLVDGRPENAEAIPLIQKHMKLYAAVDDGWSFKWPVGKQAVSEAKARAKLPSGDSEVRVHVGALDVPRIRKMVQEAEESGSIDFDASFFAFDWTQFMLK